MKIRDKQYMMLKLAIRENNMFCNEIKREFVKAPTGEHLNKIRDILFNAILTNNRNEKLAKELYPYINWSKNRTGSIMQDCD